MKRSKNTPQSLAQKALLMAGLTATVSTAPDANAAASDVASSTAVDIESALGITIEQPEGTFNQYGVAVNPNSGLVLTAVDSNTTDSNYSPDTLRLSMNNGSSFADLTSGISGETDLSVSTFQVDGMNTVVGFSDRNGDILGAVFDSSGNITSVTDLGNTDTDTCSVDPVTGEFYGVENNSSRRLTAHRLGTMSSPLSSHVEVLDAGHDVANFGYFSGESQPAVAFYFDIPDNEMKMVSDPFGSPNEYGTGIGAGSVFSGVMPASVTGTQDLYFFQDSNDDYAFKALVDTASSAPEETENEAPDVSLATTSGTEVPNGGSVDHDINAIVEFTVACNDVDNAYDDLSLTANAMFFPGGNYVDLAVTSTVAPVSSGGGVMKTFQVDLSEEGLEGTLVVDADCTDGENTTEYEANFDVARPVADGTLGVGIYRLDVVDSEEDAKLDTHIDGVSVASELVKVPYVEGAAVTIDKLRGMFAFELPEGYTLNLTSTTGGSVDAEMIVFGGEAGAVAPPSAADLVLQVLSDANATWELRDSSGAVIEAGTGDVDVLLAGAGEEEPDEPGDTGTPDDTPEDDTDTEDKDTTPRVINGGGNGGGGCSTAATGAALTPAMIALAAAARRREED